jgi:hypothetical protein
MISRLIPNQHEAMRFNMDSWFFDANLEKLLATQGALYFGEKAALKPVYLATFVDPSTIDRGSLLNRRRG